ncbi:hypothetical protein L537_4730 [Bordetella hinzii 1277]|nr:hypothetical protein L537_4730 [Bordetella hinzii 1277]
MGPDRAGFGRQGGIADRGNGADLAFFPGGPVAAPGSFLE